MAQGLDGLRILVVEDEYFVALEVKEIVRELGAEVVGPIGRLEPARDVARRETFDGAILDVKLDGEVIYPLADELLVRGVPLILTTGYDAASLPETYRRLPQLRKPLENQALQRMAESTFRRL
ncbi:response regulator [Rhodospirillaceae bacterium SYSU D60014]|uniref:response regulator n=1 Tax=Virgifigura deserti TaxID=2268457 RepID=UPI000E661F7A